MKEKIAIATVSGKAYFLLINELKERNVSFVSFIPGEPVPTTAKVVITTEKEKPLIDYDKIIVYDEKKEPSTTVNEALKTLQGKEKYEKIIIGIDPGEVFGLAVIADGKVTETSNCFGINEISKEIGNIIKTFDSSAEIIVKIGNGVPIYKQLVRTLDCELPSNVTLEVVSEAGTDRPVRNGTNRRGLRDIASAIRIAARNGHIYPRKSGVEETADFLS